MPACPIIMGNSEPCGRALLKDHEKCLFHASNRNQAEENAFWSRWDSLVQEFEEQGAKQWDFTGFVFPAPPERSTLFQRVWLQSVIFSRATFESSMMFEGARFEGDTSFEGTIFRDETNFAGATFKDEVVFYQTTFKSKTSFWGATFEDEAVFGETAFEDVVVFVDATFGDTTGFWEATFENMANFRWVTFKGEVNFERVTFKGEAAFYKTTFKQWASFEEVTFRSEVSFAKITIDRIVDFTNASFPPTLTTASSFVGLNWGKQGSLVFDQTGSAPSTSSQEGPGQDLSSLCFSHTALDRVVFRNVCWQRHQGRLSGGSGYWLTGDAYRYHHDHKPPQATHVAQVYRRLRTNFEASKRYTEAGGFFIGEMEMKRLGNRLPAEASRRQRLQKWGRVNLFSSHAWYKYLSNYGESYWRAALWCGLVIVLFTGVNVGLGEDWGAALEHSAFTFSQLRTDTLWDLVERALAILLFAQLFIALRRQFERR